MHTHNLAQWQHEHIFDTGNRVAERSTRWVMGITLIMMVVEILAGWWYNSMALLADGWHMSSHALAFGLTLFAYTAARKYARDSAFAFGSWKIEILASYTSALLLLGIAVVMVLGSLERLLYPQPIHYQEAMVVALIGLIVNLGCAALLNRDGHTHELAHPDHHDHHHHHDHAESEQNHDFNLKAAYLHVVADAATSGLAIVALVGGWLYGWVWLDPVMGLVGAVLIVIWARGLLVSTAKVLLDREMDHGVVAEIRQVVAEDFAEGESYLTDLHVWRVGKMAYSASLVIVTHNAALTPDQVRAALQQHEELVHLTIEINLCR